MDLRKIAALLICLALALSMLSGCGAANSNNAVVPENNSNTENTTPQENTVPVPSGPTEEEMTALNDITKKDAKAVAVDKLKEGTYDIKVASGSDLFKILDSKLVVVGDVMQLVLKVEGDMYSKMYSGDAAAAASAAGVSEGEVDADGNTTFRIVVKSLNEVLKCSAFADASGKWYDRTILADSDSLDAAAFKPADTPKPDDGKKDEGKKDDSGKKDEGKKDDSGKKDEGKKDEPKDEGLADGDYTVKVTFSGGTGKAKILSPATLHVKGGKMTVTVKWSSENYDYMKVNGQKYTPSSTAGGAVFTIPVPALGKAFTVIGDTTAMSTPHEIEYSLRLDLQ